MEIWDKIVAIYEGILHVRNSKIVIMSINMRYSKGLLTRVSKIYSQVLYILLTTLTL